MNFFDRLKRRLRTTNTQIPVTKRDESVFGPTGPLETWRDGDYVCCVATCELMGAIYYCGYVGVPMGHPMHGDSSSYQFVNIDNLLIHGGITWCDLFKEIEPEYWFYGFDMAHGWDLDLSPDVNDVNEFTMIAKPHVEFGKAMEETARLLNHIKCWIQWF